MEKTVYFLGSGFSKEAGGLVQNEIIKTILDEDFTRGNERLIKAKDNFIGFLKEELHIYEDHYCNVQLEDIFTPIDRCVWDGLVVIISMSLPSILIKLHGGAWRMAWTGYR